MVLDKDDLIVLQKYFSVNEHEFDYGGNAYIKESMICKRIESVDPGWGFVIKGIDVRSSAGDGGKEVGTVTVHASMTINSTTRDNTGMGVILKSDLKAEMKWEDKKKIKTGNVYTIEANQAEKTATTDALKRCARLFGIGRYMLDFGKSVSDEASLQRWFNNNVSTDPNEWNKANMTTFWNKWYVGESIAQEDILDALGISALGEWEYGVSVANERMEIALNNQKEGA